MRTRRHAALAPALLVALSTVLALTGCSGFGIVESKDRFIEKPGDYAPVAKVPSDDSGVVQNRSQPVEVFNNANDGVVRGGSTKPVTFTLEKPMTISYIQTYHWDSGTKPGEISLKGADGTVYGPWNAIGTVGQGGMPDAYWEVEPNQSLPPGTYTVIDSDPGSWSTNSQMGMAGQTIVRGYPE